MMVKQKTNPQPDAPLISIVGSIGPTQKVETTGFAVISKLANDVKIKEGTNKPEQTS